MGSTDSQHAEDGEGPERSVWVDKFRLSTTAVSNRDFRRFVNATGYVTDAQRAGFSFVFHLH
jgi:formylglycine-generating enzyme required for sulfatase activity